jgi:hypothetical protein
MMILVTLCSLFLFSSDSGDKRNTDREKATLTITVPDINLLELDLFDNLDVLSELDLRLEGLEERVRELVEMELEHLDLDLHLDGLEESLSSLGKLEGLVELECLKALEDLDLEIELSDFFDDFNWDDFVSGFDWDWDFDPDPEWD